jgi:hypothetical protein
MHKPCPVIAVRTGETKFWMTFDTGADGIMVDQSVMPSGFQRYVIGHNIAGGVTGDAPREAPLVESYWRLGSFILQAPVVVLSLHEQNIKQNIKGCSAFLHSSTPNGSPSITNRTSSSSTAFGTKGTFVLKVFRTLGSGMLKIIIDGGDSEQVKKEVVCAST